MKTSKLISAAMALCMCFTVFTGCDDGGSGFGSGHNSPETAAYTLLDAVNSKDGEQLVDALIPGEWIAGVKSASSSKYRAFVSDYQDYIDECSGYFGKDYYITADVTGVTGLSGRKLDRYSSYAEKQCRKYGVKDCSITEGKIVEFKYTAEGSKRKKSGTGELFVVNYAGYGWYAMDIDY
ncbi:MAG: hypothetical protein IKO47_08970 [Ruminococcus sp.]|nr:hypothetical protein [Ruminococcus sp.]